MDEPSYERSQYARRLRSDPGRNDQLPDDHEEMQTAEENWEPLTKDKEGEVNLENDTLQLISPKIDEYVEIGTNNTTLETQTQLSESVALNSEPELTYSSATEDTEMKQAVEDESTSHPTTHHLLKKTKKTKKEREKSKRRHKKRDRQDLALLLSNQNIMREQMVDIFAENIAF